MSTITFYSYKGGVGRSLLVANMAKYLSTLGKRVFALDLDLEAPGLHYKFELGPNAARSAAARGIIDILVDFLEKGTVLDSLSDYITQVQVPAGAGTISILRAGTAPQGDYWRKLSRVNWYELFYGEHPVGAPFFLELKERIQRDYRPDFLLIDARTGITEMGGVATTLLPDTVVCLALASLEHLEGMRAAMRGISQATAKQGSSPVTIVPVISRVPIRKDSVLEEAEIDRIRLFLNAPVAPELDGLSLDDVITLHSEPLLSSEEQLLIGGTNSPHELPLLRDYFRLFAKIIPAEVIRPHVGQLIQQAANRLLEDPDAAQSDLEALTTYCADQDAYRALIKLYQLRKAPLDKIMSTAAVMWQLGPARNEPDPLILEIVRTAFADLRSLDVQRKYAEFAEEVWRASGMKDMRLGLTIATVYQPDRRERAIRLLSDYIERTDQPSLVAVARLIGHLSIASPKQAFSIVERFKVGADAPEFYVAWAKLVAEQKDRTLARNVLEDGHFRAEAVRVADSATLYRLLTLSRSPTSNLLLEFVQEALDKGNLASLRDLAEIFVEENRYEQFEQLTRGRISNAVLEEISDHTKRRARRRREHVSW